MKDLWTTHVLEPGDERLRVPGFRLTVVRGRDKGAEAHPADGRADLYVGTQEGSDLRLTDPTVSRNHLVVEAQPAGFRVRDLGSTNGTLIAGVRVIEGYVKPGDEIAIGETTLKFH